MNTWSLKNVQAMIQKLPYEEAGELDVCSLTLPGVIAKLLEVPRCARCFVKVIQGHTLHQTLEADLWSHTSFFASQVARKYKSLNGLMSLKDEALRLALRDAWALALTQGNWKEGPASQFYQVDLTDELTEERRVRGLRNGLVVDMQDSGDATGMAEQPKLRYQMPEGLALVVMTLLRVVLDCDARSRSSETRFAAYAAMCQFSLRQEGEQECHSPKIVELGHCVPYMSKNQKTHYNVPALKWNEVAMNRTSACGPDLLTSEWIIQVKGKASTYYESEKELQAEAGKLGCDESMGTHFQIFGGRKKWFCVTNKMGNTAKEYLKGLGILITCQHDGAATHQETMCAGYPIPSHLFTIADKQFFEVREPTARLHRTSDRGNNASRSRSRQRR
eukprot:6475509-Amphidinium_carterae.2